MHFPAMRGANAVIGLAIVALARMTGGPANIGKVFCLLPITRIVTLDDRFRPVYMARVEHAAA